MDALELLAPSPGTLALNTLTSFLWVTTEEHNNMMTCEGVTSPSQTVRCPPLTQKWVCTQRKVHSQKHVVPRVQQGVSKVRILDKHHGTSFWLLPLSSPLRNSKPSVQTHQSIFHLSLVPPMITAPTIPVITNSEQPRLLHSSGTFHSMWAGWLRLHRLACCTWSLRFRYSVRADGLWAYGWYRVARAWEISQAYKVFRGDLYVLHFETRLTWELRPKV